MKTLTLTVPDSAAPVPVSETEIYMTDASDFHSKK